MPPSDQTPPRTTIRREVVPSGDVLGLRVDRVDYEQCVTRVMAAARERRHLAVAAANVHLVMEARRDPQLAHSLAAFELVVPDGQPVRWLLNASQGSQGQNLDARVYGPELMRRVVSAAAREQLPVYLFGATEATLAQLVARLRTRLAPGIKIAGTHAPAFGDALWATAQAAADRIRASGARIVLVGLGCPRQERWIGRYGGTTHAPCLAVGAAFDLWAGGKQMAPPWMQRGGLEWLYRLATEPRHTWRRYLEHNPRFMLLAAAQLLRRKHPR